MRRFANTAVIRGPVSFPQTFGLMFFQSFRRQGSFSPIKTQKPLPSESCGVWNTVVRVAE